MIIRLIAAFVMILVGVSILPMIMNNSTGLDSSTLGYAGTVLNLIPAFFALAVAGIGIAFAYGGLRSAGLLGGGEYSELETKTQEAEFDSSSDDLNNLLKQRAIDLAKKDSYYIKSQLRPRDKEYKSVYTDEGGKFD